MGVNKRRIAGLLRLFRPELPISAGCCGVLGQILALGGPPPVGTMVTAFLSLFFVSATALILNDYFDVETDRLNAPDRPLPSGMVSNKDALLLSHIVAALGLGAAALLGSATFVTALILWVVGVLYNWRYKRSGLMGNLMVAFSVGMTFVFGGLTVGLPFSLPVVWFAVISFLLDLGEEIAADAMDAEGDALIGSRSLAIVYGRTVALRVSASIFSLLIVVSLVPFIVGLIPAVFLIPMLLMDAAIVYATVRLLRPSTKNPRTQIRIIYFSGLIAVLLYIGLTAIL